MSIYVYNSLSRKKEEFKPIIENVVKIYVCGPTVYDEPHIGHARGAFIFDVVRNYFKYKGYSVKYVRNVTDVDDKIIDKAKKEFAGRELLSAVSEVSSKYLDSYHKAMETLGIMEPDSEPKATAYIAKMVKFIESLVENGAAYAASGDVYFDIKKAKDYGKLSNQSIENMESGRRVISGENKKDALDFALWKKAKEDEPSWPSPWGAGRPGWHIECSVMSSDILGDEFDIHGGGIDLIFPHHENEIAQSEGAGKKFARCWMHNGLLVIGGQKMAKSLGNYLTIADFLKKYKDPDILKVFFLSSHYRSPVDFTDEAIEAARSAVLRIRIFLEAAGDFVSKNAPAKKSSGSETVGAIRAEFEKAMEDDFNTAHALAVIFEAVTAGNSALTSGGVEPAVKSALLKELSDTIKDTAKVLGLTFIKKEIPIEFEKTISEKVRSREEARKNKDYKLADDIRKGLEKEGIIIEDTKDGPKWRVE
ncbi:MAG: cysteine--tRNA ligase [Candidatus Omnitrophota bacterium]